MSNSAGECTYSLNKLHSCDLAAQLGEELKGWCVSTQGNEHAHTAEVCAAPAVQTRQLSVFEQSIGILREM